MLPGSQVLSGTLMDSENNGGIWSKNTVENDTLTIGPINSWVESLTGSALTVNAKDLAKNAIDELVLNYIVDSNTDHTAPITMISPTKLEHNIAFDVSFSCDDGQGSGCAKIWYTVDGAKPVAFDLTLNANPTLRVSTSLTLNYYSEDLAGNVEKNTQAFNYIIENQAPVTQLSLLDSDGPFNASIIVTLSCQDLPVPLNSGCSAIFYTIGNNSEQIFTPTMANPSIGLNIDTTTTLTYRSEDKAGNLEATYMQNYVIDIIPPTFTINPPPEFSIYQLTPITITFSDTMNTNPGSLTISGDVGGESDGGVWFNSIAGTNDVLKISPVTRWTDGVGKTLSVIATDIAGNPVSIGVPTYTIFKSALNDTGINVCANNSINYLTCNDAGDGTGSGIYGGTMLFPGQDAEQGRDALATKGQLAKLGYGKAGFDFTKLDSQGVPLPQIDQTADYATKPWSCVKDNVTGLVWETKTPINAGGLRDGVYTYTWYVSDNTLNGGVAAPDDGTGSTCFTTGRCDTEKYEEDVNATKLCGFNDWRLPTQFELYSIVSLGVFAVSLDRNIFPNTQPFQSFYWTSTPHALVGYKPRIVNFSYGTAGSSKITAGGLSASKIGVMLVRKVK